MAVFAIVWLCTILYWRSSGATPGGGQMLLFLGVLPLGLLAGIWLARRGRAARNTAPGTPTADAGAANTGEDEPAEAQPPLDCLAGAVRLPCGDMAEEVLALLPMPPRPGLHPKFRDRDGLPVFAAYVEDLPTDAIADMLAGSTMGGPGGTVQDERLRALALLEPVATELFDRLGQLLPPLAVAEERVVAGLRRGGETEVRQVVRVWALVPAAWEQRLRQACGDWLLDLALASGIDQRRIALEVSPVTGVEHTWQLLEGIGSGAIDDAAWHLVLGCDSAIGERSVQALASSGRLMDSRRIEGVVPGEAAAGLLLRSASAPAAFEPDAPVAMHRVRRTTLEAGSKLRPAARATGELLSRALQRSATQADAVSLVLTDADQRPSRAAEAGAAVANACPDIDVAGECGSLGVACGEIGHVAPLALLALAAAQVRASRQAVLVLSINAEHERFAVALAPPLEDASPGQAGASPEVTT
ncbi:MAG: hypothetical protein L0H23_01590 [Luteimonas sp.]|nr:hypothetical protein [Luteimonas sp.]